MVEEFSYQKHVMSFFSCIDDLRSVRSGQMANYNLTRVGGKYALYFSVDIRKFSLLSAACLPGATLRY